MSEQTYNIYPSLLDKFQRYLTTEPEDYVFLSTEDGKYHKNYNDDTGEMRLSPDDVEKAMRQEVIDAINRKPIDSEPADKGTAWNELVDYICGAKPQKTRINFKNEIEIPHFNATSGNTEYEYRYLPHYETVVNNRTFRFNPDDVMKAANYFNGSIPALYAEAPLYTPRGIVKLYGIIDEIKQNHVFDIKTCSKYDCGKYKKAWQRHTYPYILIKSGKLQEVADFEFSIFKLSGGTAKSPLITASQYAETYVFNLDETTEALTEICQQFITFIEENKDDITDKKIFNQQ